MSSRTFCPKWWHLVGRPQGCADVGLSPKLFLDIVIPLNRKWYVIEGNQAHIIRSSFFTKLHDANVWPVFHSQFVLYIYIYIYIYTYIYICIYIDHRASSRGYLNDVILLYIDAFRVYCNFWTNNLTIKGWPQQLRQKYVSCIVWYTRFPNWDMPAHNALEAVRPCLGWHTCVIL